jgi:hypothetical protein
VQAWSWALCEAIDAGDSTAVDRALAFVEADPFFFHSGRVRHRLAQAVARAKSSLTPAQRTRGRALVLDAVAGRNHTRDPGLSQLAGAVADNRLRSELLVAVRSGNETVARRALRCLARIRHPGYTPAELRAARRVAMRTGEFGIARQLWSREWEDELRTIADDSAHADCASAYRLIAHVDRRRERRARRNHGWRAGP